MSMLLPAYKEFFSNDNGPIKLSQEITYIKGNHVLVITDYNHHKNIHLFPHKENYYLLFIKVFN